MNHENNQQYNIFSFFNQFITIKNSHNNNNNNNNSNNHSNNYNIIPKHRLNLGHDDYMFPYIRYGLSGPNPNPEWCYLKKTNACNGRLS
jgi:hypothetical protein